MDSLNLTVSEPFDAPEKSGNNPSEPTRRALVQRLIRGIRQKTRSKIIEKKAYKYSRRLMTAINFLQFVTSDLFFLMVFFPMMSPMQFEYD